MSTKNFPVAKTQKVWHSRLAVLAVGTLLVAATGLRAASVWDGGFVGGPNNSGNFSDGTNWKQVAIGANAI